MCCSRSLDADASLEVVALEPLLRARQRHISGARQSEAAIGQSVTGITSCAFAGDWEGARSLATGRARERRYRVACWRRW
jgi:hypothetical protein